jgi:hypothetical protein
VPRPSLDAVIFVGLRCLVRIVLRVEENLDSRPNITPSYSCNYCPTCFCLPAVASPPDCYKRYYKEVYPPRVWVMFFEEDGGSLAFLYGVFGA